MTLTDESGLLTDLQGVDPYHFEQLIADIWQECQGWDTEVTQSSLDCGVDIFGTPPNRQNQRTAVQAKRYKDTQLVTSSEIQQYAALRQQYDDVTAVTVVTTSAFTRPARDRADDLAVRCIDGETLVEIIDQYNAQEIVDWYLAGKPQEWG